MTTIVLRRQTKPMNWRRLALLAITIAFVLLAAEECEQELSPGGNCYDKVGDVALSVIREERRE